MNTILFIIIFKLAEINSQSTTYIRTLDSINREFISLNNNNTSNCRHNYTDKKEMFQNQKNYCNDLSRAHISQVPII